MPQTKKYDGKKRGAAKRRPHLEIEEEIIETEGTSLSAEEISEGSEAINTEAQNEGVTAEDAQAFAESANQFSEEPSHQSTHGGREKVHLEFFGSDVLREKAPKVMEIADTVAEEWVQDGQFQGLPLGNPLAQIAAAKALRKAKDVEKKLEEKGVLMMARIGFDYLKSKMKK